jgi:hypothetical protein
MTTYEEWAAASGRAFDAIVGNGERHSLRLATVSPARRANGWLGYTLEFTAASDSPLQQQTYELSGAGIADAVFLVPTGRSTDAVTLEAVFVVPDAGDAPEEER